MARWRCKDIDAAIKPDDSHFARSRLLCLENTLGGKVLPLSYVAEATALARRRGLATHLDGARLFNAAVKLGIQAGDIATHFDSVSVCFSKGLGAPAGSALVGSRDFVKAAHRWRKMLGGGMRQAGVLAAACVARARPPHRTPGRRPRARATPGRRACRACPGLAVEPPQTNIVFADLQGERAPGLMAHLKSRGILATGLYKLRFVTHLDVDADGVDRTIDAMREHLLY